MGKYDLLDQRYRERREVLADLVAVELHEQCVSFPTSMKDLEWDNAAFERRFRSALPQLPPPDASMMALLCNLLDMEVDHEIEEIDRLIRSGADRACCPTPAHVETLHFLWRVLLLHLEDRCAQMQDGFKRADKKRVVATLRKRSAVVQLPQ